MEDNMNFRLLEEDESIEIIETYDYYDGPLNFTFNFDKSEKLYYAHYIVDLDRVRVFWVVEVSKERMRDAEQGKVDLRTLLTEPEKEEVHFFTGNGLIIKFSVEAADIVFPIEEFLVKPNVYLMD